MQNFNIYHHTNTKAEKTTKLLGFSFNGWYDLGIALPRDCKLFVGEALTSEQIEEKRKEVARVMGSEKIVDRIPDARSSDDSKSIIAYLLAISKTSKRTTIIILETLKKLNIVPKVISKGKIKKASAFVELAAILVAGAIFLGRKLSKHVQGIIDRLFGRNNDSIKPKE